MRPIRGTRIPLMPIARPIEAASRSPLRSPPRSNVGRVAPALLVAATVAALVAAGFGAQYLLADHGPSLALDTGALEHRIAELERQLADLTARLDDADHRVAPAVVRTEDTTGRRTAPRPPGGGDDGEVAGVATATGGRNRGGRRGTGLDELRRLDDAADDTERLKIARELATSADPTVAMGALRVLADLAPKEALALVDQWFAQSQKGDLSSWQVDRALAALADGKGAEQIAGDLKDALRRYFRDGGDAVKVSAARALEKEGDSGAMQQLVASLSADLGNADVGRRSASIEALAQTRSRLALPLLLPLLSDGSDEVRLRTLDALRRTGDATSIEKVLPLLNDPVAAVRDRATRTIESLRRGDSNPGARGGGFNFGFGGRRGPN